MVAKLSAAELVKSKSVDELFSLLLGQALEAEFLGLENSAACDSGIFGRADFAQIPKEAESQADSCCKIRRASPPSLDFAPGVTL